MKENTEKALEQNISWSSHPASMNHKKAVYAIIMILAAGIGAGLLFKNISIGIISSVLLFSSAAKFFIKTEYKLSNNGVEVIFLGFSRLHNWNEFRAVIKCKSGILLSPFYDKHRLDTFRGVLLYCDKNYDEVYEFAEKRIKR